MQVLAFAGEEFLHQRHAESLGDTALDLPLNQSGINGAAYIVCGDDLQNAHRPELDINSNFRHVSAESVHRIWNALAVLVEWAGRGIESLLGSQPVPIFNM